MKYVAQQLKAGRESTLSGEPDPKEISQAAQQGDALAQESFNRAGHYLGLMIANYLMIFNPSIVILGGGVSQAGDLLFEPVRRTVRKAVLSKPSNKTIPHFHQCYNLRTQLIFSLALEDSPYATHQITRAKSPGDH